jgi:hypothetical protein
VLDALDGEQQFAGMQLRPYAEFAVIVAQHRADLDAEFSMKRQDPLVEQIAGGDRLTCSPISPRPNVKSELRPFFRKEF